jgi:hypothetical protein
MIKVTQRKRRTSLERIFRVRLENMRKLIAAEGGPTKMAKRLDCTPAFLTHIAGQTPIKVIGEKLARDTEVKLGLFSGWLDSLH